MAQIESRPAFRLPWTADRSDSDQPIDGASTGTSVEETPSESPSESPSDGPISEEGEAPSMIDTTAASATRRPTKFMADLSRAMQTAAEVSRDETMARLSAEVKTVVEEIHAASTVEAAALRRRADDDVAAVREWSKAEIARIRDEAEARVATRKVALDGEMDAHGKVVEARVEQVTATVSEYEARMTAFFEHLMAEQDPTRIATMAEAMPDPPDLAGVAAAISEPPTASFDPNAQVLPDAPIAETTEPASADPEASAAQEGSTEASETAHDFAAAEAEAAAFTGDLGEDDELRQPAVATESDAPDATDPAGEAPASETAAGDAPASEAPAEAPATDKSATRVVVLGLVSVASIATFKRSLGRTSGVSGITVASGPDGEFVFTVNHDAGVSLADAITALPGFEARITAETADGLEVAAHDPDAAS